MVDVHHVEAIWVLINLTTFVLTLSALIDARADRSAVKLLNGHARELVAEATVRREGLRLIVQSLLLVVVVPGLFSSREIVLSPAVVALMTVPVVLLSSSFFDARNRKALTALVAAEIAANHAEDRLEGTAPERVG